MLVVKPVGHISEYILVGCEYSVKTRISPFWVVDRPS
jgi:hypothetical protein